MMNNEYNDELYNSVYDFLEKFSEIYRRDHKRNPNLQEFGECLRQVCSFCVDDKLLSGLNGYLIEDVKFKVVKKKKKQDYAVGDIFAIPLPSGGYGFGRIIYLDERMWYVCEIFSYYSKLKLYKQEIEQAGQLIYPVIIPPTYYFSNWIYTVIHRDPSYTCPYISELRYVSGEAGTYWENRVGEYGKGPAVDDQRAENMNKYVIRDNAPIIENALKKKKLIQK